MEKDIRKILNAANQIEIQMTVLDKLKDGPLTSREMREFIEGVGGEYETVVPILKGCGLIKTERANFGRNQFVYTLVTGEDVRPKWWNKLVVDCRYILEDISNSKIEIIRKKHQLGTRILNDEMKYKRYKFGSGEYIADLASELEISEATIRDAVKFACKFKDIKTFIIQYESQNGNHLTWSYIKNNLLYNHKKIRKSRKKKIIK